MLTFIGNNEYVLISIKVSILLGNPRKLKELIGYYEIHKTKPKVKIDHSQFYKNKKLSMVLNNHIPQPLNLSHTLCFD